MPQAAPVVSQTVSVPVKSAALLARVYTPFAARSETVSVKFGAPVIAVKSLRMGVAPTTTPATGVTVGSSGAGSAQARSKSTTPSEET